MIGYSLVLVIRITQKATTSSTNNRFFFFPLLLAIAQNCDEASGTLRYAQRSKYYIVSGEITGPPVDRHSSGLFLYDPFYRTAVEFKVALVDFHHEIFIPKLEHDRANSFFSVSERTIPQQQRADSAYLYVCIIRSSLQPYNRRPPVMLIAIFILSRLFGKGHDSSYIILFPYLPLIVPFRTWHEPDFESRTFCVFAFILRSRIYCRWKSYVFKVEQAIIIGDLVKGTYQTLQRLKGQARKENSIQLLGYDEQHN